MKLAEQRDTVGRALSSCAAWRRTVEHAAVVHLLAAAIEAGRGLTSTSGILAGTA
jgi:hypothetical protein